MEYCRSCVFQHSIALFFHQYGSIPFRGFHVERSEPTYDPDSHFADTGGLNVKNPTSHRLGYTGVMLDFIQVLLQPLQPLLLRQQNRQNHGLKEYRLRSVASG